MEEEYKTIRNKDKKESKVKVRFITKDPNIRVPEVDIGVPLRLGRLGLSEVIGHLRGEESPSQKPFDFLVNGKFIRTTLEKHLKNSGLLPESDEHTVIIEYLEAITEPKKEKECQHDDWVSCVEGTVSNAGLIVSGSYDLGVRIWDYKGELLGTGTGHQSGVKSVTWITMNKNTKSFASSSLDKTIRLWEFVQDNENNKNNIIKEIAVFTEHTSTVDSITSSPDGQNLMSGGMDGLIKLWKLSEVKRAIEEGGPAEKTVSKKRKTNNKSNGTESTAVTIKASTASIDGAHTMGVTTVSWPTQYQMLSGSMDRSMKLWDLNTLSCSMSVKTPEPLSQVSYSVESGLAASAHSDKIVRVWDPRSTTTTTTNNQTQSLISHKNWVTSVQWKPNSQYHLCTGSHDGSVKLWDIRTKIPLFSIDQQSTSSQPTKILCTSWVSKDSNSEPMIVSGGSDSKLKIHFDDQDQVINQ
eukprot:gene7722-9497_t